MALSDWTIAGSITEVPGGQVEIALASSMYYNGSSFTDFEADILAGFNSNSNSQTQHDLGRLWFRADATFQNGYFIQTTRKSFNSGKLMRLFRMNSGVATLLVNYIDIDSFISGTLQQYRLIANYTGDVFNIRIAPYNDQNNLTSLFVGSDTSAGKISSGFVGFQMHQNSAITAIRNRVENVILKD